MDGGFICAGGHAVAADAADLPLLELVVVAANPAGILSLSLPHNLGEGWFVRLLIQCGSRGFLGVLRFEGLWDFVKERESSTLIE